MLDQRCFAVRDAEAQPLGIALRSCAAHRDDDCVFATRFSGELDAPLEYCGLNASSAILFERARSEQRHDPVLGDDEARAGGHELAIDFGDERQTSGEGEQRRERLVEALRFASIREKTSPDNVTER